MPRTAILLAPLLFSLATFTSPAPGQSKSARDASDKPKAKAKGKAGLVPGYTKATIQGFTLIIHEDVYKNNDDARWKRKPLDVIDLELATIVKRLPARFVTVLRRILLWIEWEDKNDPDLKNGVVAKYYGAGGNLALWSLAKGKHPGKANNVEVINMRSLTAEHQPGIKFERCVLLHELAHAVHHQALGSNNATIKATYLQAMKRNLYGEARDVYGRVQKPTYAAKNEREYFAELTCAYLDKLHYFPFTPDDLKKHDPQGYKLMEVIWGSRKKLDGALKAQAEKAAAAQVSAAERQFRAGKKDEAVNALERVMTEHADTKAAARAKALLAAWKKSAKVEKE